MIAIFKINFNYFTNFILKIKKISVFFVFLILSCDSSIVEFNNGFAEGYKEGLKSNGCKELKKNKIPSKNKSWKNGYEKGYQNGTIDCIKIMKQNN